MTPQQIDTLSNEELDKLAALHIKKWTIKSYNTSYKDDYTSYADFYVDSRGDVVDRCTKYKPTINYNESILLLDDLRKLGYYFCITVDWMGWIIRVWKGVHNEVADTYKSDYCSGIVKTCLKMILKEQENDPQAHQQNET